MGFNAFELYAKIGCDTREFDQGLEQSGSKLKSFGDGIKNGLGVAAKIGGAALAAGTAAATSMAKAAIDGYADFEQLEGGIETLFGDAAPKVLNDAADAFKTAGMSMNDYMDTSIQSAAALINSLGGDQAAAADLMNMSITDMADNVNKMGTSMEGVQNAYRGFSRGNFTMLDNLALGFAGTKEGMQELLDKAQELSGVEYNIDSYADIVQAIHVVQDEMGITGTTAKEASETISGSLSSLKSAWDNLVTGMARDDADMGQLIDSVVSSAETALGNILPVAERALGGISQLIANLAPVIAEQLPGLIDTVLPPLLSAASDLIGGLASALPGIISAVLTAAPGIVSALTQAGLDMVLMLVKGLSSGEGINQAIAAVTDIVTSIADWIGEYADVILQAGVQIIITLAQALTDPGNISNLVDSAVVLMLYLAEAIINALPQLIEAAPLIVESLVTAIVANVPKLLDAAWEMIVMLVQGLIANLPQIFSAGQDILLQLTEGIIAVRQEIADKATELIDLFNEAIKAKFADLVAKGSEIVEKVKDGLMQTIEDAKNWGRDLISNFIGGIKEKWDSLKASIAGIAQSVRDFIGFSEPKKGALSDFHTFAPDMMELYARGIRENKFRVLDEIGDLTASVQSGLSQRLTIPRQEPQPVLAGASGGSVVNNYYTINNSVNASQIRDVAALIEDSKRAAREQRMG